MVDSATTVLFSLAFVAPGFVAVRTMGLLVALPEESGNAFLLRCLTYSFINHALWFWKTSSLYLETLRIGLLPLESWSQGPIWWWWLVIGVLSPMVLGVALGWSRQNNLAGRLFQVLRLRTLYPASSAWDRSFEISDQPRFVVVRLKDGSTVYGGFVDGSFAGATPCPHDLYLRKQFSLGETGEWSEVPRTMGVYIAADQVSVLEFYENEQEARSFAAGSQVR